MKKIMILLATYNGERYLEEQLESLILQKNVIFKILVRDDGSTDGTLDILRRWEKNGQLTWYSGTHTGVQMGYYELMKKAGEYESDFFAFCDQDDRWDPDKLETAVKELSQFPDTMPALYYSGQRLTDENLVFISNHCFSYCFKTDAHILSKSCFFRFILIPSISVSSINPSARQSSKQEK